MYTLFGQVRSRALRPLWLLEELGVPFDHVPAQSRSAEVIAVNPSGKIPVLVVDGTPIRDSTAILTYLADRHGAFTHAPGTLARANQDSLTQMVLDDLDSVLWTAARHSFVLPEDRRLPAIKDSLRWEFARSLDALAERMGAGPYLAGDRLTIADIVAVHCGIWAEMAKFPVTSERFRDYLERLRARPAFRRASARG